MIMAGGTGGHIFPALAVADRLRDSGLQVVWLGARRGMEERIVPAHGYRLETIDFAGVRGKGLVRLLVLPVQLLRAFWQAARLIRRVRPDAVLGMGGYVSFPGGLMAVGLNRPLVVHEQNAVAGLANRVLARVADRVLTAFPGVFGSGVAAVHTGNPVRGAIGSLPAPDARYPQRSGPLRVLVIGGSLGAQVLNEVVPRALALLPAASRPAVVHQSGAMQLEQLQAAYRTAGVEGELTAFIDDMAVRYAQSDLVICRAGAITIAELACAGVAAVLVPLPHAVDDHQTFNARFLVDAGAAILLPQAELTPARLRDVIARATRAELLGIARRARALARPDAAQQVADVCTALAAA
jgi:UDP-N-acetylglucosamine--N-acetylmuramyl-(pentapeptide) pyrophosphoryl-undecaprenol N-acetylglucosamine transferase